MCKEKRFWAGILFNYIQGSGDKEADDFCIRQLLPNKLKDQYCFKTEAAIKCLKFVKGRNRELSPHS